MSFFAPTKGYSGIYQSSKKPVSKKRDASKSSDHKTDTIKTDKANPKATTAATKAENTASTGASEGADDETTEGKSESHTEKAEEEEEEEDIAETETQINTRLNALIYHTSDETVDLYKKEHNSSDLLGRLYYDDYDSDSVLSDGGNSAQISPVNSAAGLADYFSVARFGTPSQQNSINEIVTGSKDGLSVPPASAATPTFSIDGSGSGTPGSVTPKNSSLAIGSRSPSASAARIRPAVQRLASFERGVSFDNSLDGPRRSLTFKVKHPHFKFRRNNKTYLAGYDGDLESVKSIEWLFDEMIINGDTIIVLQVLDERTASIDKKKANENLKRIELLNKHVKKVSLVFEVVVGKPLKMLQAAIEEYHPQMMAIGTHNYEDKEGKMHEHHVHKSFLSKSSMSKHFLECALIPVIIVKPYYEHIEMLRKPVDSEQYFQDWIASSDIAWTYSKDKNARKKRLASPLASRNGSSTNLAAIESRGRKTNSHTNLPFLAQAATAAAAARAKDEEAAAAAGGESGDSTRGRAAKELVATTSRSSSGSRSRSRSRTGFRKLFGHHHHHH